MNDSGLIVLRIDCSTMNLDNRYLMSLGGLSRVRILHA